MNIFNVDGSGNPGALVGTTTVIANSPLCGPTCVCASWATLSVTAR